MTSILHHFFLVAAASVASASAFADSVFNIPDGSKDLSVAITGFDTPRSEGGKRRQFGVLPSFTGRWSNGVFADLGELGWDVSDSPVIDYGPIISYDLRQRRTDDTSGKGGISVEGGEFAHYMFAYNINFNAMLLYGGGARRDGARLVADIDYSIRLGAHSALQFSPGVEFANASYMKSTFAVTPVQATIDRVAPFETHAGAKDAFFNVALSWQATNKWTFVGGVNTVRLVGSAAASPLTQKRTDATAFLSGDYHF